MASNTITIVLVLFSIITLIMMRSIVNVPEGFSCSIYGYSGNSLNYSFSPGTNFIPPYAFSKCLDMRPQKYRYENVEIHARNTSKAQSYPLIYVSFQVTDPVYILNNYMPETYEDRIVEEKFRAIVYSVCTAYNERQLIFENIETVETEIHSQLSIALDREGIKLRYEGVQIVKPPGPMSNELHAELEAEASKRQLEKQSLAQEQEDTNLMLQVQRSAERRLIESKSIADAKKLEATGEADAAKTLAEGESHRYTREYLKYTLYNSMAQGTKWVVPDSIGSMNIYDLPVNPDVKTAANK